MSRRNSDDEPTSTAYDRFYNQHAADNDDWTWGEVVWKAARKQLLKEQRARRKRARKQ